MSTQCTAVVTGTASGMGRAAALIFLRENWRVIGLDVAETEISHEGSGEFVSAIADVRYRDDVTRVLGQLLPAGDSINAVANIAGIYPPTSLDNYDEAIYRRIFDTNVLGVVNVIAAVKSRMPAGSSIVNFASVDAFVVSPGQLFYGASKAAVVMLTRALALELAPVGIRVNGIAPGWVATPGNAATGRMEEAAASIPLGRVAQPHEIAEWVWMLSSPQNVAFMTGETVVLSGGDVIR